MTMSVVGAQVQDAEQANLHCLIHSLLNDDDPTEKIKKDVQMKPEM